MKKATKEKPVPAACICGGAAVIVKARGGKMVSCPNPEKCRGNLRTLWRSTLDEAITDWNTQVAAARAAEKGRKEEARR